MRNLIIDHFDFYKNHSINLDTFEWVMYFFFMVDINQIHWMMIILSIFYLSKLLKYWRLKNWLNWEYKCIYNIENQKTFLLELDIKNELFFLNVEISFYIW